jgi:hypothetical protein
LNDLGLEDARPILKLTLNLLLDEMELDSFGEE